MTTGNFVRAAVIAVPLAASWFLATGEAAPSGEGIALAVTSGAITSGLGYAVWYRALRGLSATRASIVQLSVPPLAALGGVALGEVLDARFAIASAMILAGIALTLKTYANSK